MVPFRWKLDRTPLEFLVSLRFVFTLTVYELGRQGIRLTDTRRCVRLLDLRVKEVMNGMSDLDLVAQAMGTSQPAQPNQPNSSNQPNHISSTQATQPTSVTPPAQTQSRSDPLATVDLSTLTASDRQALQPLIDAIVHKPDGENTDEEVAQLLAQMDVADHVADDLEGKLDRLLANLGKVEEEIGRDLPAGGGGIRLTREPIG